MEACNRKMKLLIVLLFAFMAVHARDGEPINEALLRAQRELSVTHGFFEEIISSSRSTLSGYIEVSSRMFIDSHINAYGKMKTVALDTDHAISEIAETESNRECLNRIKSRWGIQIQRYGQRLSTCMNTCRRSK